MAIPVPQSDAPSVTEMSCEGNNIAVALSILRPPSDTTDICGLKIHCTDGANTKTQTSGSCPTDSRESVVNGTMWSLNHVEACMTSDKSRVATLIDYQSANSNCKKLVTSGEVMTGFKASFTSTTDGFNRLVNLDSITKQVGLSEFCSNMFDIRGSTPPGCPQSSIPKCSVPSEDQKECLRCQKDYILTELNGSKLCVRKELKDRSVASYTSSPGNPICLYMRNGYKFRPESPTRDGIIFNKPCSEITDNEAESISFSVNGYEIQNFGATLHSWDDVYGSLRAGADDRWTNKCRVSNGEVKCKGFPVEKTYYIDTPIRTLDEFMPRSDVEANSIRDLQITTVKQL